MPGGGRWLHGLRLPGAGAPLNPGRIRAEGINSPADLPVTVDAGHLWRAEQAGLFAPVASPAVLEKIPAHLRGPRGRWFGFSTRARLTFHDKRRFGPGELAALADYEDLADPRWRCEVCIRSSGNIYNLSLMAYPIHHHGLGAAEEWARGVVSNFARPLQGGDTAPLLSLVLCPYVYLLARAAFLQQSRSALDASRTLGCTPLAGFFRVALPMARPALVAGTLLALMETLADFGTVSCFGVPVFTTGIYRAWFSLGDPVAAAKLSAALLGFVVVLMAVERRNRAAMRFHQAPGAGAAPSYRLRGARAGLATTACALPVLLGFALPAALLAGKALTRGDAQFGPRYLALVGNTLLVAGIATALTVLVALVVAYGQRLTPSKAAAAAHRVAGLGYAVPGSIIAVAVLIPLTLFDNALDAWLRARFGVSSGLLLTGGIVGLVYAYLVRFLAVALQTVDAAARSLGHGPGATLQRVHLPMLRGSLLTAMLIVFVEVTKELPAALILRPFDFDTLAVQAYNLASDERLAEAATAALAIVAAGLGPVILLSRQIGRGGPRRALGPVGAAPATAAGPAR